MSPVSMSENELQFLRKRNNMLKRMFFGILPLAICGLVSVVVFISNILSDIPRPISEKDAIANVEKYRNRNIKPYKKGHLALYDTVGIRYYLDYIYPEIVKRQTAYIANNHNGILTKTAKWKIGFYWMIKYDANGKKRWKQDFCFVPTLVDSIKGDFIVYDYFSKNNIYQHPDSKGDSLFRASDVIKEGVYSNPNKFNAFDEGTLWP